MNAIYHNLLIRASIEKVYKAISSPKELENWWALRCNGTTELGGTYNLYFGEAYDWYGQVAKLQENTSFHVRMTIADTDWTPTTFGFDLEEKKEGVYVRFFHKDWAIVNDHFKHSSFCWAQLLDGLKSYVEKGEIIPFEQRN